jgi:hypothetical protein
MDMHSCHFRPAKRGKHLVCECGERFPCANKDCGHVDCWEERGDAPVCHFCNEKLIGEHNTENSNWGCMAIRNKTYAAHYCCRDANETTSRRDIACRARGGYFPEPCSHQFEGKNSLSPETINQLKETYVRSVS